MGFMAARTRMGWLMAVKMIIEVKTSGILNMGKRTFNNVMKEVWYWAGRKWHRDMRLKHFAPAGAREYGYTPRSRGYMLRKAKGYKAAEQGGGPKTTVGGHQRPLWFTGASERDSKRLSITSTFKGATVHVFAPRLNFRPKGGRINLGDEMTRVSGGEQTEMGEYVLPLMIRAFESHPEAKVRRLGDIIWIEN